MNLQMNLEDTFHKMALNGAKPAVLLCDRGAMDGSAYLKYVISYVVSHKEKRWMGD